MPPPLAVIIVLIVSHMETWRSSVTVTVLSVFTVTRARHEERRSVNRNREVSLTRVYRLRIKSRTEMV